MRRCFALVLALAAPIDRVTAQVLTLTEYDLDRGRRAADGRNTPAIVDINSLIHIQLSKDSLRRRAAAFGGAGAGLDSLVEQMQQLQRVAAQGLASLGKLGPAMDSLAQAPADRGRQDAFREAAGSVAIPLTELDTLFAREGTELRERILTAVRRLPPGASIMSNVQVVFQVAAEEAERLRASVDSLLRADGVSLLLGAWLWTRPEPRPVHLPGFDVYPEGDFVMVDRWSLALTDEQKSRLQALTTQAEDLRERHVDVATVLHHGLQASLRAVAESAARCATRMRTTLEGTRDASAGRIRDALTGALDAIERSRASVAAIAAALGPGGAGLRDPAASLTTIPGEVAAILGELRGLRAIALASSAELRASPLATRSAVAAELDACATSLASGIATLENDVGPVTAVLGGTRRIDAASLAFGQEVLRLDVAAAPDDTRLDLKWTGARGESDVAIVRLGLARRDDSPTTIEEHQLVLYRVIPHLRLSVDLVFADPVPHDLSAAVAGRFQPGAATSVLYSWGSRRWAGYNRFWRLGVGLNFAALDLNRDGSPELGIGLALSAFAGLAQGGLGYDVGQDAAYWFFGLAIPLLNKALAVPGGGANEASTP